MAWSILYGIGSQGQNPVPSTATAIAAGVAAALGLAMHPGAGAIGLSSAAPTAINRGNPATGIVTVSGQTPSITRGGPGGQMAFLTPTSLNASQGLSFSLSLQAVLGLTPYTATLVSQSGVNAGTWVLNGTTGLLTNPSCANAGTDTLVMSMHDVNGLTTGNVTFTVTVAATGGAIVATDAVGSNLTLTTATVGGAYYYKVRVSGGHPPYHLIQGAVTGSNAWNSTVSADTLYIQCAPTVASTDTFSLSIIDANGTTPLALACSVTTNTALAWGGVVANAASQALPTGMVGVTLGSASAVGSKGYTFQGWGGSGTGQTFTVVSGSLPPGVSISGGILVGTPTTAGNYSATIQLNDSASGGAGPTFVFTQQILPSYVVSRPSWNSNPANGMFTLSGRLFTKNGTPFTIRGINQGHYDDGTAASYNNARANAIRYFMYNGGSYTTQITDATNMHAANGRVVNAMMNNPFEFNWSPSSTQTSGTTTVNVLNGVLQDWINNVAGWQSTAMKPYLIVNVANEWGPIASVNFKLAHQAVIVPIASISGTTLTLTSSAATHPFANFANSTAVFIPPGFGVTSNIYAVSSIGGSSGAWTVTISTTYPQSGATNAFTGTYTGGASLYMGTTGVLRGAGYTVPISIDAGGSGGDLVDLQNYSAAILASDPLQNVIFSLHIYPAANNIAWGIKSISGNVVTMNTGGFYSTNPGDWSSVGTFVEAAYLSGLGGTSSWNNTSQAITNYGGSQAAGWSFTLGSTPSGTYTGGGYVYGNGSGPNGNGAWTPFTVSRLTGLANEGCCVMVEEMGPVAPPAVGAGPFSLSNTGDIIQQCELNFANWQYWSFDDSPTSFGCCNSAGNFTTPASLTVFGSDVILNASYGLKANALPIATWLNSAQ